MEKKRMNTSTMNENTKVTLRKGYWFYFEDAGLKITAFGSGFSGKEIVYINDEIVSEKRNYRFKSTHYIQHNGARYKVSFEMKNMITGELICSLTKNNELLHTESKAYISNKNGSGYKTLLWIFLIGLVAGIGFFSAGIWIGKMLAGAA
jgi:hypothetical protein